MAARPRHDVRRHDVARLSSAGRLHRGALPASRRVRRFDRDPHEARGRQRSADRLRLRTPARRRGSGPDSRADRTRLGRRRGTAEAFSRGHREASPMKLVVTGACGFIGSHLTDRLLAAGHEVVGIDGWVPFYPREMKEKNIAGARSSKSFALHETLLEKTA